MADQLLKLKDFVRQAEPDQLRVLHRQAAWCVRSGALVLQRVDGSTAFETLEELLGVLASVGIRYSVIEWDGLAPQQDRGLRPAGASSH